MEVSSTLWEAIRLQSSQRLLTSPSTRLPKGKIDLPLLLNINDLFLPAINFIDFFPCPNMIYRIIIPGYSHSLTLPHQPLPFRGTRQLLHCRILWKSPPSPLQQSRKNTYHKITLTWTILGEHSLPLLCPPCINSFIVGQISSPSSFRTSEA